MVVRDVVSQELTNRRCFKQWTCRRKLDAEAIAERFNALFVWAEKQDATAPVVDPNGSCTVGAQKLPQQIYASLVVTT